MNDDSEKKTKISLNSNTQSTRWALIQNDLEKALISWDELGKDQPAISQEEQQLAKIKSIINQLKEKLDQF